MDAVEREPEPRPGRRADARDARAEETTRRARRRPRGRRRGTIRGRRERSPVIERVDRRRRVAGTASEPAPLALLRPRARRYDPVGRDLIPAGRDLIGRQAGDSELGVVLSVKRRGVDVRRGHRRRGHARAHVVHSRRLVRGGDLPRLPLPPSAGRGAVLDRAVVVDEGPHEALRARGAYPVRRGERHCARRGGEGELRMSNFFIPLLLWRTNLEGEGVSGGSHRDGKPRDAGRGGGVTARGTHRCRAGSWDWEARRADRRVAPS